MGLRFAPARGAATFISTTSRGPAGAAATIAAGSATALAAGASPTVTNSGSSSAATLNFGIPRGADAGIKWLYDSSTSMADPGSGDIRFNHATLSSVTAIAVSATGSGSDVSDYVVTWDDSTNTVKGHIVIREEATNTCAIFALTAVTDNTDWLQLTVTYVSGSLTLTAADPLYVVPLLIGNKGSDGAIAGSTGATDNRVLRADGTGGSTLQSSAVTIDDSGNMSGVGTIASGAVTSTGEVKGDTLAFNDSDDSHKIAITTGSNATANRTLTINPGDADRTLTISGNATISQDYSTTGNPQFATIEVGAASDTTVSRSSAGVIAVEGETVHTNSTSRTLTASTIELGHASDTTISRDAAGSIAIEGVKVKTVGKETIWVPAGAMKTRAANGAAAGSYDSGASDLSTNVFDFDQTSAEYVHFTVAMPKGWNESTVTFIPYWTADSGSGTVTWTLAGRALGDDDAINGSVGTAQSSADTLIATGDLHIGPESSAITIGNTPAENDLVWFELARDISDTLNADARLIGIKLFITTNAATDA